MASNLATRDSVPRDTPATLPVKLGPQHMQPYAQVPKFRMYKMYEQQSVVPFPLPVSRFPFPVSRFLPA